VQDPRLTLLSTVALSLAAFASAWGALLALAWWLLATPRRLPLQRWRSVLGLFILVCATAALVALSGGNGPSYLFRISVVLLIASWAYGERRGGELLDMGTWAFGNRTGFELGLIAEMAVQSLGDLDRDLAMLRLALRLKTGGRITLRSLVPALGLLVRRELDRSRDLGDILAVRGYRKGGSLCPGFARGPWDGPKAVCAVGIALLALLP
jgi:energy-coupling factor transporter transmembrane protein EcfT